MKYVLDASALLAFLTDEPGADVVEDILHQAERDEIELFMHYVNLGEVYYIVFRHDGEDDANTVYAALLDLPIRFVNIREVILLTAGRIKATQRVSYADAFGVATCLLESASFVTADHHEIEPLESQGLIAVHWVR